MENKKLKDVVFEVLKSKGMINDADFIFEVYKKYSIVGVEPFSMIINKVIKKELPGFENILRTKREVRSKLTNKHKRLFLIKELHEEHKRKAS